MRFLLAIAALCCFLGNSYSADEATAKAENTVCCCGKPVDPAQNVSITAGDKTHTYGTCGAECTKALQAMKPEDAVKAMTESETKNAPVK